MAFFFNRVLSTIRARLANFFYWRYPMQLDPIHRSASVANNSSKMQQKTSPRDPGYRSTLVSSTSQSVIGRFFDMAWGMLKSIFETVFFCCNYSGGIFGNSKVESLKGLRGLFETLREEFVTNRETKSAEDFKAYWIQRFDSLPPEAQERIVKESMVDWANSKEADVADYVNKAYANPDQKAKALLYVRELIPVSTKELAWDPKDDSQLPALLMSILEQLGDEIAQE